MKYYIGYDIGAISVNRAVLDENKKIVDIMPYTRHYGEPVKIIMQDLDYLINYFKNDNYFKKEKFYYFVFTGSGGKYLSSILKTLFVNEIEALINAVKQYNSQINAVIEIGGQDSKFIDLTVGDYSMNELCAAGTGSFLDQQASRFGLTIEQFAELALKSSNPSSIAGRCSVFAKSDMIHLQQEAASDEDIALGLCFAMARSFKSGIIRGKKVIPPIMFCGGVSFNMAMLKAFESVLNQKIFIPSYRESYGAIGAALSLIKSESQLNSKIELTEIKGKLNTYLKNYRYKKEVFKPLRIEKSILPFQKQEEYNFAANLSSKVDAYIGIDVGSISTNVVAIDANKKLIYKVYLRTAGRPIEAVRKGIEIIGKEVGDKINVKAVGTTGSGRYLIGDLVGADIIINEITAQATAAADIDNSVDTIFEIGGQDSKYISLEKGVVVDFEMNKICAAGTGSFLEEQAERFDIKIQDFGDIALTAAAPLNLGERCTVFMETNVYSHYQKGASIEDILAGLAYSIAINYINRVVGRKKIGNRIFFQGAVAFNKAVVAAFENYLGKKIIVPPNHEVTGAIGTAIKALESQTARTKFRGFDEIKNIKYKQSSFECHGCPNICEIKMVKIDNTKPLYYGGRCEKYEKKSLTSENLTDFFAQRDEILLTAYKKLKEANFEKISSIKNSHNIELTSSSNTVSNLNNAEKLNKAEKLELQETQKLSEISKLSEKAQESQLSQASEISPISMVSQVSQASETTQASEIASDKIKIGIPFTMLTYEFYPFWQAFFSELGFEVILSDKTNKKIINDGLSLVVAETCFPMKVMLGHVKNLIDKNVDYIFIPSIRDMPCPDNRIEGARTGSYPCPFVQGISSFVKSSIEIDSSKILDPIINFSYREYLKNEQLLKLGQKLGKNKKLIYSAIKTAYQAQEYFYKSLRINGKSAINSLSPDQKAAVIISRPYNSCDANISMDIPGKLRDIGIQVIPLDYLPVDEIDLFHDWPNMYWEFGDRILSAVEVIKKDKRLYPVYITNFGCGPDSFIMQYFEREIDRPFLKIEIDEHTAGAGVITRCEAFYDSLKNISRLEKEKQKNEEEFKKYSESEILHTNISVTKIPVTKIKDPMFKRKENRKIFIPYMGDGAYALEAVFKSAGINSEVMISNEETLEIGRKYTLGKECYPYIITTGDILKTLKYNDPKKCAFLMPLTHGPCRFGQYNKMQKILLKELGYLDVPVVAPGAPESAEFYKEYDMQGRKGAKLYLKALVGIFAIDNLNKLLRKIRPYEINEGQANQLYNKLLDRILKVLESPLNESNNEIIEKLVEILKNAVDEFYSIPLNKVAKPRIGIVGEIYVRNHPFSNNEIIKKVEELGGEVEIPDFSEWAYHTNATSKLDVTVKQKDILYKLWSLFNFKYNFNNFDGNFNNTNFNYSPLDDFNIYQNDGFDKAIFNGKNTFKDIFKLVSNFSNGIKFYIANRFFRRILDTYKHKLEQPLKNVDFIELDDAEIYQIWDNAEPYIIKWFGEAALSVGKSIDWIKKDIDGIINVLPFTCMPGTMVTAISKRIRENFGVPWLNIAFDGLEQGTTETRLEAFMFQAKIYKQNKSGKKPIPKSSKK